MSNFDQTNQFKQAMRQHGLIFKDEIIANGTFQRFHITDDSQSSKNGWYVLHGHGEDWYGTFGCWKRDIVQSWSSKNLKEMTQTEKKQYQKMIKQQIHQSQQEKKDLQKKSAQTCQKLWGEAEPASSLYPYLQRKKITLFQCI